MSLSIPSYIQKTGIAQEPINYEWDDEEPQEAYLGHDNRLADKIDDCAERAVVALSLGFAEWTMWRLVQYTDNRTLAQFIEAIWVGMVDWRYIANYETPDPDGWEGPILGPLWGALDLLSDVVELVSTNQFSSPECVCLSQLALHVIPDPKPFKDWRRFAIKRLSQNHPNKPEDTIGLPVPREALDPDFKYTAAEGPKLIANFLSKLDYAKNPFLATPEQMRKSGFERTPYVYP